MLEEFKDRYDLEGFFFLAPALIFLLLGIAFPLFKVFQLSFQEYSVQSQSFAFVGLKQYQRLFSDPLFGVSLKNTFIFTGGSIALHLAIAFPIALLLNAKWPNTKARNFFRGALIFPFLFSAPAAALVWGLLYFPLGPLNYIIERLSGTTIAFLGDTRWALASILFVNTWWSFPLYMILILGGLQSISKSLYDAARVDGANWLQSFRYVTLPQLRSLTMTIIIIDFATTFIHFDLVWIMTRGGPLRSTYLISFFLYQKGLQDFRLGYGAAIGVIIALIAAVCIATYMFLYSRGERTEAQA
ncbi:MAG: carbohydrate ABC transporter permease [Candidatus Bipolaricaulia bacterium]